MAVARQGFDGLYDELVEAGDRLFALLDEALGPSPENRPARAIGCWAFVHGLAMMALDDQLKMHPPGVDDESLLAVILPFSHTLTGPTTPVSCEA